MAEINDAGVHISPYSMEVHRQYAILSQESEHSPLMREVTSHDPQKVSAVASQITTDATPAYLEAVWGLNHAAKTVFYESLRLDLAPQSLATALFNPQFLNKCSELLESMKQLPEAAILQKFNEDLGRLITLLQRVQASTGSLRQA